MSLTRYKQSPTLMQEMQQFLKEGLFDENVTSKWESGWMLNVDIIEYNDHFTVAADLPGLSKKDLEIFLENNTLIIKGTRQQIVSDKKCEMLRHERYEGQFYRCITLPQVVNEATIDAHLVNGVLTINIPKAKKQKSHMINIQEH